MFVINTCFATLTLSVFEYRIASRPRFVSNCEYGSSLSRAILRIIGGMSKDDIVDAMSDLSDEILSTALDSTLEQSNKEKQLQALGVRMRSLQSDLKEKEIRSAAAAAAKIAVAA